MHLQGNEKATIINIYLSLTSRILQHLCHKLNPYFFPRQTLARLGTWAIKLQCSCTSDISQHNILELGTKLFYNRTILPDSRKNVLKVTKFTGGPHWPDWPMVDYCSHKKLDCLLIHCNNCLRAGITRQYYHRM